MQEFVKNQRLNLSHLKELKDQDKIHLDVLNQNETSIVEESKKFLDDYKQINKIKEPKSIEIFCLALTLQHIPVIDKVIDMQNAQLNDKLMLDYEYLELYLEICLQFDPNIVKTTFKDIQVNQIKNMKEKLINQQKEGQMNVLSCIQNYQEINSDNEGSFWVCDFLDKSFLIVQNQLVYRPLLRKRLQFAKKQFSYFKIFITNKIDEIQNRFLTKDENSDKNPFQFFINEIPDINIMEKQLEDLIAENKQNFSFTKHIRNIQSVEIICETAFMLQEMCHSLLILSEFDSNIILVDQENKFTDTTSEKNQSAYIKIVIKVKTFKYTEQIEFKLYLKWLRNAHLNLEKIQSILSNSYENIFNHQEEMDNLISEIYTVTNSLFYSENNSDKIETIKEYPKQQKYLNEDDKFNYEITSTAIKSDGRQQHELPSNLKQNKELFLMALDTYPDVIKSIDPSLKNNKDIGIVISRKYPSQIKQLDQNLVEQFEIINQAVRNNGLVIEQAGKYQLKNNDLLKQSLNQNGLSIICTDSETKQDQTLVMQAVKQNGLALKYVDHSMLKNKDIIFAAYCNNTRTFEFADISLKNDLEFVKKCYDQNVDVKNYINEVMLAEMGLLKEEKENLIKIPVNQYKKNQNKVSNENILDFREIMDNYSEIKRKKQEKFNKIFHNNGEDILTYLNKFQKYDRLVEKVYSKLIKGNESQFSFMDNINNLKNDKDVIFLNNIFHNVKQLSNINAYQLYSAPIDEFLLNLIRLNENEIKFKIEKEFIKDDKEYIDISHLRLIHQNELNSLNDKIIIESQKSINLKSKEYLMKYHEKNIVEQIKIKELESFEKTLKTYCYIQLSQLENLTRKNLNDYINKKIMQLEEFMLNYDIFTIQIDQLIDHNITLGIKQLELCIPVSNYQRFEDINKKEVNLKEIIEQLKIKLKEIELNKSDLELKLVIQLNFNLYDEIIFKKQLKLIQSLMTNEYANLQHKQMNKRLIVGQTFTINGNKDHEILINNFKNLQFNLKEKHQQNSKLKLNPSQFTPIIKCDQYNYNDGNLFIALTILKYFSTNQIQKNLINQTQIYHVKTIQDEQLNQDNINILYNPLEYLDNAVLDLKYIMTSKLPIQIYSGYNNIQNQYSYNNVIFQLSLKYKLNYQEIKYLFMGYQLNKCIDENNNIEDQYDEQFLSKIDKFSDL